MFLRTLWLLLANELGAVTLPLVTNWLFVQYLKTNEINKQLLKGSESPLFQSVAVKMKVNDDGGKDYTIPQWRAQKSTASRDSQTSFDRNSAGATGDRAVFIHQMVPNFDYVIIERQTRLASSSTNVGTFFETLKSDADQSVGDMEMDIVSSIYGGNTGGSVGKVDAISGSVITLDDNDIVQKFQKGKHLEFAAAVYGGSTDSRRLVAANRRTARITRIDYYARKITLDVVANIAANDIIWSEGNYLKSAEGSQHVGLSDYTPATAITSTDNFLKMNRYADPVRLSGYFETVTNGSDDKDDGDAIMKALVKACVRSSSVFPRFAQNKIVANPVIHTVLSNSYLREQIRWIDPGSKEAMRYGTYGFTAFKIRGSKGDVPVVYDSYCPVGEIHGLHEAALQLRYMSYKKGMVIAFKTEGDAGGRIHIDQAGKNNDIMMLESYTFMANYLPGSFFKLDVSAVNQV